MADRPTSNDLWIFGYGSLIFRVDFEFIESAPAYIDHYARKFWQGSTDHRGVPGRPGRVVTLTPSSGTRCYGRAFRIDPLSADEVLKHLDYREKGGYDRLTLPVHLTHGRTTARTTAVSGLTYYANSHNPNFLGSAPVSDIATQIVNSTGPSGPNTEYALKLDEAITEMNAQDAHVSEVANLVRSLAGTR